MKSNTLNLILLPSGHYLLRFPKDKGNRVEESCKIKILSIESLSCISSMFQYFGRYLILFLVIILFQPSKAIAQIPGIINIDGDTTIFFNNTDIFHVCEGECVQFIFFFNPHNPPQYIFYRDSIYWYFKGGFPERTTDRDPLICFPNLRLTDTIELWGVFYDTLDLNDVWSGSYTTNVRIVECHPEPYFNSDRRLICAGEYITYRDSSKRAPVEWLWEFEGGEPATWSGQEPPPIFYADPGFYETRLYVGNESGEDSLYVEEYIEVMDRTSVESSYKSEVTVDFGEELFLFPCYRGDEYQWFPEEGLSCTDCATPRLTAGHIDEYTVIMGIEGSDCRDTCSVKVNVRPVEEKIWFPNVFSPNDDGYNDFFFGIAENIAVEELRIFNRWGQEVFRSEGYPEWNGRDMSGQPVDQGVYVYMAIIRRLYSRESGMVTGDVTVLR